MALGLACPECGASLEPGESCRTPSCLSRANARRRTLVVPSPGRRTRPQTKRLAQNSLWVVQLRDRAEESAVWFRRTLARARHLGFDVPLSMAGPPSTWPANLRLAWEENEKTWAKYWHAYAKAPDGTRVGRDWEPSRGPVFRFRLDGQNYRILRPVNAKRKLRRFLEIWFRHYARARIRRCDLTKFRHLGILNEFGDLLGPRGRATPAVLAQRFKIPKKRVASMLRRYRRLTRLS